MCNGISNQHVAKVWVRYGIEDEESWSKFELEKRYTLIQSLPIAQKHHSLLPMKQSKLMDVRKLVVKYVPLTTGNFMSRSQGTRKCYLRQTRVMKTDGLSILL